MAAFLRSLSVGLGLIVLLLSTLGVVTSTYADDPGGVVVNQTCKNRSDDNRFPAACSTLPDPCSIGTCKRAGNVWTCDCL